MRIINFLQKIIRKSNQGKISSFAHNKITIPLTDEICLKLLLRDGSDMQNACQSFLNYLIFFRSSQIGDFLIKIFYLFQFILSPCISSFLEKKNPPVCLNGLRQHTTNSIYLYLLLISQLKPFRSFIRNHALELQKIISSILRPPSLPPSPPHEPVYCDSK